MEYHNIQVEQYKAVAISTAHMHKDDSYRLSGLVNEGNCGMITQRDTGFFIKFYHGAIHMQIPDLILECCSEELERVLLWAAHHGFTMVEFDCDAGTLPWFPTFEW